MIYNLSRSDKKLLQISFVQVLKIPLVGVKAKGNRSGSSNIVKDVYQHLYKRKGNVSNCFKRF